MKNSIDIFYFACIAPLHIFFSEEGGASFAFHTLDNGYGGNLWIQTLSSGAMEKKTFLNTWKDIPAANEIQHTIEGVECTSDGISTKMSQNNVSVAFKHWSWSIYCLKNDSSTLFSGIHGSKTNA